MCCNNIIMINLCSQDSFIWRWKYQRNDQT